MVDEEYHEDAKLTDLAKTLVEIDEEVHELETRVSEMKQQRETINKQLTDKMLQEELTQIATKDKTLYLNTKNYYSALADTKDELFELLIQNGYENAVKKTVHPQTLGSICSELTDKGELELPEWIKDKVNHYSEVKVTIRKK